MKKQFFRVKQLADQTFLRAEKSKTLSDEELQIADHKVEYLRAALSAINKKLPPCGPLDVDKRAKKCLEYQLGTIFLEQCYKKRDSEIFDTIAECRLFQDILREAGGIEQQLAKEYAEHEVKVEDLISIPIQKLIDSDFPTIMKYKRNLTKYSLDKDSTSSRYQATKKETLKDELEEADVKVEQCRDALAIEMFNLLAKENEFASYILQLLKLQRGYHESALNNLQTMIPQLEKKIGKSSTKRVFGIPLEEHLAVTNKRIAYPLEICITALAEVGMYEEGLFRLTGSTSKVKRFKASIDSGCFCEIIPEYRDVHVIASILKLYLRELPEPLLTYNLHHEWMQVVNQPENQRVDYVKGILKKLPRENIENLTYLIQFLAKLSHNTVNKMSPQNIAIVMSPNLLWGQNDDANLSMGNYATVNILVELFIKEVDTLFKDNVAQYVTPLNLFVEDDKSFRLDTEHHNELSASSESIQITDSPKPNTRKKKTAPVPPNSISKTDHDLMTDRASLSLSYPSGSSTLSRKPKEAKSKTSVGTNTEGNLNLPRRSSFGQEDKKNARNIREVRESLLANNVEHKFVIPPSSSTYATKVDSVPVSPTQNAGDDKKFKTTITHTINSHCDNKPVAAPRNSIDNGEKNSNIIRASSIRSSTRNNSGTEDVQLRRPEVVKPEIPARPASLQQKRSSFELLDPTLQRTQCSVYSVANKQQPSFVNLHNRSEKYQLGHDSQIAEKEKFLGHQPIDRVTPLPRTKLSDNNLDKPPCGVMEKGNTVQSISERFLNNEKQWRMSEKPVGPLDKPLMLTDKPGSDKSRTFAEKDGFETNKRAHDEESRSTSAERPKLSPIVIERPSIPPERPTTLPERPGLPPKCLSKSVIDKSKTKSNEKLSAAKSNEKLHEFSNGADQRRSSHSRTRSDGNLIELKGESALSPLTPSSPRSLNKPTEPPPPPPVQVKKLDGDSTDL